MKRVICGTDGEAVVTGGKCKCSFGTSPGNLCASSDSTILSGPSKPVLSEEDNKAGVNIMPMGQCNANPNAPVPCNPNCPTKWIGESRTFTMDGKCVLLKDWTICCSLGGTITIESTGQ